MRHKGLPLGDTVNASALFHEVEKRLWEAKLAGRDMVFTIGNRPPISRDEAEKWVANSAHQGFPNIRYVVEVSESGIVSVDLAASD